MLSRQRLRRQISNVSHITDIIYSTELTSASRLRKSQSRLRSITPYSESIERLLQDFAGNIDRENVKGFTLLESFNTDRELLLVIGGERGLCGGYIIDIVRKCEDSIKSNTDIIVYGTRTGKTLYKRRFNVIEVNALNPLISFESIQLISKNIQDRYISGRYGRVKAIYLSPKTAFTSIPAEVTLIPLEALKRGSRDIENYIIEPSSEEILRRLLPMGFPMRLYRIFLEAITSEYSARRIAMHQAYENAKELLKNLNVTYQKLRQESITREIIEVSTSKVALEGERYE